MFAFSNADEVLKKVIDLKFVTDYPQNGADLDQWRIESYKGKNLKLWANFTRSDMVSIYADLDHLHLEIKKPEFFISLENGLSMEGKTKFELPIRPLLEPPAN